MQVDEVGHIVPILSQILGKSKDKKPRKAEALRGCKNDPLI
jgi:hypothetical protein